MQEFLIITVCAVLYAIKGGQHGALRAWVNYRLAGVEWLRKIADRLLDGKIVSSVGFGLLVLAAGGSFINAAVAWLVGVAPSIGEEIGATGGIKGNWQLLGRRWGWTRGAIRGVFFGALLALALGDTMPIVAGATFPLSYWLGVSIEQLRTGEVKASWHIGELIYGAAIGAGVAMAMGGF